MFIRHKQPVYELNRCQLEVECVFHSDSERSQDSSGTLILSVHAFLWPFSALFDRDRWKKVRKDDLQQKAPGLSPTRGLVGPLR